MSDQITTRDEFRRDLAALHETLGAEYERAADNPMHGATHADVFGDLACTIADARHQLERLLELMSLDRLADLATSSPARPLEAVLADIRALGHQNIHLSWHHDSWYLDTDTGSVEFDQKRHQEDPAYLREYRQTIESALSWGEDPVVLTEARLEQIKEFREQQRAAVAALVEGRVSTNETGPTLVERITAVMAEVAAEAVAVVALVETLGYRPELVHFRSRVSVLGYPCGRDRNVISQSSDNPSAVTCPVCQDWLRDNTPPSSGWPLKVGEVTALTTDPFLMPGATYNSATDIIAGTGFIRIEGGQDGPYAVGELARKDDALPFKVVKLLPGEAPEIIDGYTLREAAEAVRDAMNADPLYRNPGPEAQPVADGPTDDEEASLARADRERESQASEEVQP